MCKNKNFLLMLFLALVSVGIYLNSLQGEFLIDDTRGILQDETIHNYKTYFSKHFIVQDGLLGALKNVFLWHFSGADPFLYHLFNVITHAICVILLFLLLNLIFHNQALSFLSSLIFAIHPIHTEVVSWISGGTYAFGSLFFISALIFYIKAEKSLFYFILSCAFFILCLFTAHTFLSLPLIFLLFEIFFRKDQETKSKRTRMLIILAIFIGVFCYAIIRVAIIDRYLREAFYFKDASYLIVIAKAFVYYLKLLYLPLQRGLYHPFIYMTNGINKISPAFFLALIIIPALIFIFFKCLKKARPVSFGIAFFAATYLPYSNIIPVCNIVSERYMYLPSVGFCVILAYLFLMAWQIINKENPLRKYLRIIAMAAMVVFLIGYAALTFKRNGEYRYALTYWITNINNFPDGYKAYNNLACSSYAKGNTQEAKFYFWIVLMVKPDDPLIWCNLGRVYLKEADLRMARLCYREALRVDNDYIPAAYALEELNKTEETWRKAE